MAYADALRSKLWTPNDAANLIEGIVGSSTNTHPATWTSWTPTYGGSGSMTYGSVTTIIGVYAKLGKLLFIMLYANGTVGGTPSTDILVSAPAGITFDTGSATTAFPGFLYDSAQIHGHVLFSSTNIAFRKDGGNWNAGANKYVGFNGVIRCL